MDFCGLLLTSVLRSGHLSTGERVCPAGVLCLFAGKVGGGMHVQRVRWAGWKCPRDDARARVSRSRLRSFLSLVEPPTYASPLDPAGPAVRASTSRKRSEPARKGPTRPRRRGVRRLWVSALRFAQRSGEMTLLSFPLEIELVRPAEHAVGLVHSRLLRSRRWLASKVVRDVRARIGPAAQIGRGRYRSWPARPSRTASALACPRVRTPSLRRIAPTW